MTFTLELRFPTAKPVFKTKKFNTTDGRRGWAMAKRWADSIEVKHTDEYFIESIIEKLDELKNK